LGFWGDDLEITIDFGKDIKVESLKTRFFNSPGVWIYSPKELSVSCKSSDGKEVTYSKEIKAEDSNKINVLVDLDENKSFKTRYIKLTIPNYGMIPDGLQGAGHKAWTFIDEIIIE
jgi:hexosaminidase